MAMVEKPNTGEWHPEVNSLCEQSGKIQARPVTDVDHAG